MTGGNAGDLALLKRIEELDAIIALLKEKLLMKSGSYVPNFTWDDGGTAPTVQNVQAYYSVVANICFIYARYNITAVGSPGSKANLRISLPEGIVPALSMASMISLYQSEYEPTSDSLGVRAKVGGYLEVVKGVGGNYSAPHIKTGYQGFSVFFMID